MKKIKILLIFLFSSIFLISCASKNPKSILDEKQELELNTTLLPTRYNAQNSGLAPSLLDPFISQNANDLEQVYPYNIKLDENRYLEQLFRAWDKNSIAEIKESMWALNYYKKGFNEKGKKRSKKWFKALYANANAKSYASINQGAIIIRPTLARNLPTNERLYGSKIDAKNQNFDLLQESVLGAFLPVMVLHYSKDGKWAFVRTDAFYSFVKAEDLMLLDENAQKTYRNFNFAVFIKEDINIITNSKTLHKAKKTKTARKFASQIRSRIGTIFPYTSEDARRFYFNGKIGENELKFNIPKGIGSHFLMVNDENLKNMANELIGQKYGWGGQWWLRDCSLFTKDFFASFGLWLPRNSQQQGKIGTNIKLKNLNNKQKQILLNNKMLGLTSLLVMPGHVMIYAGGNEAVHNVWGIRTAQNGRALVAKTAITDLELGKGYEDIKDEALLLSRLSSATLIIDPQKIALEHAYGVRIVNDEIRFDNARVLSYSDINASAIFSLPYGLYKGLNTPRNDAGRVRIYELFDEIYGKNESEIKANLKKIIWLKGVFDKPLEFNAKNGAADALERVSAELSLLAKQNPKLKNLLKDSGTFKYRVIAGTNALSAHAYGIAIDIGVDHSTYWRWHKKYKNALPAQIIEIFERNGFIWGGRWEHFDTMHFEYRPEFMMLEKLKNTNLNN